MPSTLLDARQISRHHGARTLLDAIDLRVDAGSRIALIGPNGSGKSTLLRILAGLEPADGGPVRARGTVGYLPQLATETPAAGGAGARGAVPPPSARGAGGPAPAAGDPRATGGRGAEPRARRARPAAGPRRSRRRRAA